MTVMAMDGSLRFNLADAERLIGQQAIEISVLRRELQETQARYAALVKATAQQGAPGDEGVSHE